MHTRILRRAAAAALAAGLLSAATAAQTLTGRIPISTLPVTLGQPGSYELTGNLSVSGAQHGIDITVEGVTLEGGGLVISSQRAGELAEALPVVARRVGARLREVRPLDDSLESVFRELLR